MSQTGNDKISNPWIACKQTPQNISDCNAIKLNDYELIAASSNDSDHESIEWKGIHKYNVHKDEWSEFIEYPKHIFFRHHRMSINQDTNRIYLSGSGQPMVVINIETKEFYINSIYHYNMEEVARSGLVNANGIIHIIGGWDNSKHLTWDDHNKCFKKIHDFTEYDEMDGVSLIYVPSKQQILLIGGTDDSGSKKINIWRYYLISNKWKKINGITFEFHCVSSVLTSNEEYIIIAGGYDKSGFDVDCIHVLDISDDTNYKLYKSSICCPVNGPHNIIKIGKRLKDELFIIGWFKQYVNLKIVPMCIIQLIAKLYNEEMIYWIQRSHDQHNHFAISLKCILSSLDHI